MPKEANWPPPQETASYIIFKDGVLTKAKHGSTGDIQFSNADSATVINYAANALTHGGLIHIKAGVYDINAQITIPHMGTILEGEGLSWNFNDNAGTMLSVQGNFVCLFFTQAGYAFQGVRDLSIDGNLHNVTGVQTLGRDIFVEDVSIHRALIGVNGGTNLWVRNCWLENISLWGVIDDSGTTSWIEDNIFYANAIDVYLTNVANCIIKSNRTESSTTFVKIAGNLRFNISDNIIWVPTSEAILVVGAIAQVLIHDNNMNGGGATPNFFHQTAGAMTDVLLEDNSIRGLTGAPINLTSGFISTKGNIGFNPYGVIVNPFDNVNHLFGYPAGGAALPTSAIDYTCIGLDCIIDVTGGTVTHIYLKDPAGVTISDYVASAHGICVPIGYIFQIVYTVNPTIVVSGN